MSMHKLIMNASMTSIVDHINGIRHDNRKSNLRITTTLANAQNKKIYKNKISSQYKGVFYCKKIKKYQARVSIDHKYINLGYYTNEINAAKAYDMFIIHHDYNHMPLNFANKIVKYKSKKYITYKTNKDKKKVNYFGVHSDRNKYTARLYHNNKLIYIKHLADPILCAKAYDEYVVENKIPNKKINFPSDYPNYNVIIVVETKCEIIDNDASKINTIIENKSNTKAIIDRMIMIKLNFINGICIRQVIFVPKKITKILNYIDISRMYQIH
ncbi:HNH endonuclease [Tupanvirus soda lake]|uniref:HNH endonuclease n=1 Tax=Tupanvirus deep ocean TaxID=2126984 RepID=A0AC59HC72_9VIRU|nr:HNH endonuclease [Tupanvirus soda lake]AUL77616.2 HNH endonuclease [Tupanvirus soda lake]